MNALPKDFTDAIELQFSKLNKDVQDALDQSGTAKAILFDLEQKMARAEHYGGGTPVSESWGEQFADAPELKAFAMETSRPGRFRMEIKTTIGSGSTSGGPLAPPTRDNTVNMLPQRRPMVRDLLTVNQVTSGSVEYPRQTLRTNNANTVAEGELKPESAYGFTLETTPMRVIAHWVPAARQIIEDAPQLRGLIDTELLYGLALKEDAQLIGGDGTGQNLTGLIPAATTYVAPFTPGGTLNEIDKLGLAILQSALADEPATGIIVHPSDWMRMRLLKDADGKYILGDPGANVPAVLFGLPVVATQAMAVDSFLVGNFPRAATLYDRWVPRVEVSTEHADFFTRNLVAILAEERLGLAIKNRTALTFGDFGNVA